jgi:HD-like signal output (HDOD) protein
MISAQAPLKDHILRLAQKLPTSPQIFGRLSLLLNDFNADIGKIVNLIGIDTGLTSRVLRLSNSVFFRGSLSVQSLDEAINRVGFREVHKIVGVAMTEQIFKDGLPSYRISSKEIFENSVTTALAMEHIARAAGEDEHEAYTMGLLRPIGKLVLGRILEKEHPGVVYPEDIDLATWERARFNIASHEATAFILEAWKLPIEVFQGVRNHHQPEVQPEHGALGAMLHLSCWVAQSLGKGLKAETGLWETSSERLDLACVSERFIQDCVIETGVAFDNLKQQLATA